MQVWRAIQIHKGIDRIQEMQQPTEHKLTELGTSEVELRGQGNDVTSDIAERTRLLEIRT